MTISETFLQKKIENIDENDLVTYFQKPRKESDRIEYKSYTDHPSEGGTVNSRDKKKLAKIFWTVVAFLNTDGGLLIWGAPKGSQLPDEKEDSYSGNLTKVPTRVEPDEFFAKVVNEISPFPTGISFQPVSLVAGGFCYVIEVIKSETTPHQFKGTYFLRAGASTHTAPHPLVEAMIKKITFPKLEAILDFADPFIVPTTDFILIPFTIIIQNQSHFINEKNMEFRFVGGPCDLIEIFNKPMDVLNEGFDKTFNGMKVFHKNVAFTGEYCLAVRRLILKNEIIKFFVAVSGESSPVVSSYFEFKILYDNNTGTNPEKLDFIKKEKNQYLWESKASGSMESEQKKLTSDLKDQIRLSTFYNYLKKK
jgi:hypothetical protein